MSRSMKALRLLAMAAVLGAVACGRGAPQQEAQQGEARTNARLADTSADLARPLTRVELAMFAPLPAVMTAAGQPAPTTAQVDLGRRLYHETRLSNGHDVSCNSCHALNAYGADGRRVSFGSAGHTGGRNSPTVYNAAGHVAQFWDGRAKSVEEQAKGPVLNPVEMGMPDSAAVLAHLRESLGYRDAFRAAFPGEREPVTYDNVGRAIGAFERGLVTPARWDRYLKGDATALSPDEQRGLATFVHAGCASCHNGVYVGGNAFQKVGFRQPWPAKADSGRIKVTHSASDLYVFKVPSLRNVEKTGPYFHDGSVAALDSAIRLMGHYQLGRDLTGAQVRDIRAWLGALTGALPAAYIAEPPQPRPLGQR